TSYGLAADPSRRPSSVQAAARRSSRSSTPTKGRNESAEAGGAVARISRTSRQGSGGSSIAQSGWLADQHWQSGFAEAGVLGFDVADESIVGHDRKFAAFHEVDHPIRRSAHQSGVPRNGIQNRLQARRGARD